MNIEQGRNYIRRYDMGEDGQPKEGVRPVKVLFPALETGQYVYEIMGQSDATFVGVTVRVSPDGCFLEDKDEHRSDLLPWPDPPRHLDPRRTDLWGDAMDLACKLRNLADLTSPSRQLVPLIDKLLVKMELHASEGSAKE